MAFEIKMTRSRISGCSSVISAPSNAEMNISVEDCDFSQCGKFLNLTEPKLSAQQSTVLQAILKDSQQGCSDEHLYRAYNDDFKGAFGISLWEAAQRAGTIAGLITFFSGLLGG